MLFARSHCLSSSCRDLGQKLDSGGIGEVEYGPETSSSYVYVIYKQYGNQEMEIKTKFPEKATFIPPLIKTKLTEHPFFFFFFYL